ncbi:MAG: hypothetical protein Tsb005_21090 [Gammaproteobacteria bacterium]
MLDQQLFAGIDPATVQTLLTSGKKRTFQAGEYIIKENQPAQELYIVTQGKFEVIKVSELSRTAYPISEINERGLIGEMSLLDQKPRSSSVRALTEATVLTLYYDDILKHLNDAQQKKIFQNIAQQLSERLRQTNIATTKEIHAKHKLAQLRVDMGLFFCLTLVVLNLYIISLSTLKMFAQELPSPALVSLPTSILILIAQLYFMKRSSQPLAFYGLTFKKLPWVIKESLIFSVLFMAIVTLIKALILSANAEPMQTLFVWNAVKQTYPPLLLCIEIVVYALLLVPTQEIISRGAIQSSLQQFLIGPRAKWYALLIANLIFSTLHSQTGGLTPFLVFVPGLLWGWMYARHRNVIGVILSHVLIGGYMYYVLGFHVLI